MNRQWAHSLGLRQFNKPKPIPQTWFQEDETVDMFDRLYVVRNGSFRFVEYTDTEHTSSIVRDKVRGKTYLIKHPAIISPKAEAERANLPN